MKLFSIARLHKSFLLALATLSAALAANAGPARAGTLDLATTASGSFGTLDL